MKIPIPTCIILFNIFHDGKLLIIGRNVKIFNTLMRKLIKIS